MLFWKVFAWIAFGWAIIALRGAGIIIKKRSPNDAAAEDEPEEISGPGWRRVSVKTMPPKTDGDGPAS